jgi:nitrite reductase/ring-hydroxylating ferredoxin subunit
VSVAGFVKVGRTEDFREGHGVAVNVDGDRVAVFRIDGRLAAVLDRCPHMAAQLSGGTVEDGRIVCERHDWSFDPVSGKGGKESRSACLRVYDVKTEGNDVFVRRPEEPQQDQASEEEDWVVWDDSFLKSSGDEN